MVGDAAKVLKTLGDASIQLIVTSPPYWCIKDYGSPLQIGVTQSYKNYLMSLAEIWVECVRVLESGCRIAINVGDQFLRASENGGVYCTVPIHADIIRQIMRLPGMLFLGNIIWRKITTTKTTGGCKWMGSIYYPRDGHITYEHEYILLFKKKGKARKHSKSIVALSELTKDQRSLWFRGIWSISPVRQIDHPAAFPIELPERLIRMFTFYGETVLDPFVGSGTVLAAAQKTGRSGIGIDIEENSVDLCRKRVNGLSVVL